MSAKSIPIRVDLSFLFHHTHILLFSNLPQILERGVRTVTCNHCRPSIIPRDAQCGLSVAFMNVAECNHSRRTKDECLVSAIVDVLTLDSGRTLIFLISLPPTRLKQSRAGCYRSLARRRDRELCQQADCTSTRKVCHRNSRLVVEANVADVVINCLARLHVR
jgi:hypothetical protein